MEIETKEMIESYINGNISEFKTYIKNCSKLELLEIIEKLETLGERRFNTITRIRGWLEVMNKEGV